MTLAVVAGLWLAACASGAGEPSGNGRGASIGPTSAVTPTSAPAATPASTPFAWGPATWVTGREVCSIGAGQQTADPDGISKHSRGGTVNCTDEANDPRVTGTVTGQVDMDFWGPTNEDGALVEWGPLRLENAAGAWLGQATGTFTTKTGDRLVVVYRGTGAYEGFSYLQWLTPALGEVTAGTTYVGLIFPGDPPPR